MANRSGVAFLLALALGTAAAPAAPLPQDQAGAITLTRVPSTVRRGEAIQASLRIETRQPVGDPKLPTVDGLRIRIGNPTRGTSMVSINGRSSVSYEVKFPLEILPLRVGKFEIPPIEVPVGDKVFKTRKRTLDVVASLSAANFGSLTVVPSCRRAYVHEPVRFDVECAIDSATELNSEMARNGAQYYDVQIEAEWLTEFDGGELMDVPDTDTDRRVHIVVNRMLQPCDVSAERGAGGKSNTVFRFHKSILPTRAGKQWLVAPLMRFKLVQGVRRDAFGFPVRGTKEYIVADEPIELEVLPLPAEGRPDPFYGGVGRFRISAAFDKQTVSVGGSVKLSLTISGSGNTEYLRVPELNDLPGFHLLGKIENRSRDKVVATYDLTPKTAEVTGIAPIEWNFFDTSPGTEKYVSIKTEPLSLTVRALAGETSLSDLPGEKPRAVEPGVDDIFDVKPATGTRPAPLPGVPTAGVALAGSLLPWVVCFLGLLFWRARRRSLADVAGRRAKGALRTFRAAIDAGGDPLDAFVGYLADRLGCEPAAVIGPDLAGRLAELGLEAAPAHEVQELVDRGVAARYGGGGCVDRAQVVAVVRTLEATRAKSTGFATPAPLLLGIAMAIASGACTTGANAQDLARAEKAYRDRDYVAAAEEYRAAADAGDRRASYNLGNCMYRQGLFARALAAYEKARLAMPRDPELRANIRLVREKLDLGSAEGEAFAESVAAIRDSYTPRERFWICVLCNALAAVLICFGGRRLRVLGFVVAVPALLLIVELAFLLPRRPPKGIVVQPKVAVRAEPSADLTPLMQVRGGVAVEVLGAGSSAQWTQVRVEGRKGWLPSDAVVVVD